MNQAGADDEQEGLVGRATAVIVHYGAVEPTLGQVEAVRRWASRVVVIANDGTLDDWYQLDPDVRWVVPDRNLGYGGAANAALAYLEDPVVVILNTDISIPQSVAREACRAVLAGKAAVVGLRMTRGNGEFLSGAGSMSRFLSLGNMRDPDEWLQCCEWVTGAAMFLSRECLGRVRFDERYFLGMEDVDFCVRARDLGFEVAVLGAPGVVHEGGRVIGSARWYYYSARNPIWYVRMRRGRLWALVRATRSCLLVPRVLVADITKQRGCVRTRLMLRGILHGVALDPAPGSRSYPWEPVEVPDGKHANA